MKSGAEPMQPDAVDRMRASARLSDDQRYYVFDGAPMPLPRVSTILEHTAKPGLDAWRRKVGYEEADRISKEATAFGSRVHALTEKIDRGEPYDEPDLEPWAVAWRQFVHAYVEEFIYIEQFVFSLKHGYAGTIDRLALLKNGHTGLIDIKTSKYPSEDYGVQLAAYHGAIYEQERLPIHERLVVFLPSNKPYCYAPDWFDDLKGDWAELIRRRDSWLRAREKEDYWKKRLRYVDCRPKEAA